MSSSARDLDRIGIVGAGIIGLATAWTIHRRHPGVRITILEKEPGIARHQTSRNSGVVHTGIYYTPGSLKARLCTRGRRMLKDFCSHHDLPYEECGKVLIAVDPSEEPRLRTILERGLANGVEGLRILGASEIAEVEPHARGHLGLHCPTAAIVDFAAVARCLAREVTGHGGEILTGNEVTRIDPGSERVRVTTSAGSHDFSRLVVCAGLYADTVAELCGDDPDPRVVPFRGEYMALRPERNDLVRGLIYPVPDPRYPFLGVHLTRMIDGRVLVGPNAILAFAREGYKLTTVDAKELRQTVAWPGFRAMARRHWRTGAREMYQALNRRAFVRQARRYVPELRFRDVQPGVTTGVRAQAVDRSGNLVDDFRISRQDRVINVRNAPSPAATSSLAIAEMIADEVVGTDGGRQ